MSFELSILEIHPELSPVSVESAKPLMGGIVRQIRFANDYGVSIAKGGIAYAGDNTVEIAVIKFDSDGHWELVYDTPITDDVLGWQSYEDTLNVMRAVAAL